MWHDLHCIAQEFTVWKRRAATGNPGAPFVLSGCIHTHTQDVGHDLRDIRPTGMEP